MYIYSVTIHIEKDAEHDWLKFMAEKHIPEILSTGYFKSCSIRKSMDEARENVSTYNMEYIADSEEAYHAYIKLKAPLLRVDLETKFKDKFTAERIFYKVISFHQED